MLGVSALRAALKSRPQVRGLGFLGVGFVGFLGFKCQVESGDRTLRSHFSFPQSGSPGWACKRSAALTKPDIKSATALLFQTASIPESRTMLPSHFSPQPGVSHRVRFRGLYPHLGAYTPLKSVSV